MAAPPSECFCSVCGLRYPATTAACDEHDAPLRPVGAGDDQSGTIIRDKYLLIERLGDGGFGAVYRALHMLGRRHVAVTLLHVRHQTDDLARKLFLREAQAVMRIRSEHAVIVHDIDKTEEGSFFIVMELLQGGDLESFLRRQSGRRIEPAVVTSLVLQVAEALDAAHAEGVVHRDVKPANVMIEEQADGGLHARLVDFGIARLAQVSGHETTEVLGTVMGTPHYMSPEQARGLAVEGSSDFYSLGAMTYRLLSGEPPFESETAQGLLLAHVTESPPRLDESHPDLAVPAALCELTLRLMSKTPSERPGSRQDIAAVLAGAAVEAAPVVRTADAVVAAPLPTARYAEPAAVVTSAESDAAPAGPRRLLWAVAAAVLGLVAVGVGLWASGDSAGEAQPHRVQPAASTEADEDVDRAGFDGAGKAASEPATSEPAGRPRRAGATGHVTVTPELGEASKPTTGQAASPAVAAPEPEADKPAPKSAVDTPIAEPEPKGGAAAAEPSAQTSPPKPSAAKTPPKPTERPAAARRPAAVAPSPGKTAPQTDKPRPSSPAAAPARQPEKSAAERARETDDELDGQARESASKTGAGSDDTRRRSDSAFDDMDDAFK